MFEELKKEHKIMRRIIQDNGLTEKLLNDDEFIEHLNTEYNDNWKSKLKDFINYDVEMQLYMQFNDRYCSINEHMGDIYDQRDYDDLQQYEEPERERLIEEAYQEFGLGDICIK